MGQEEEKNDTNNNLDKAAKKIINLLGEAEDDNSCVVNSKEEKYLVYISIEPVSKLVQVIHPLTQIDGSITNPTTMMVAIKGFSNDA